MKSPIAFFILVLGCILGGMVFSGTIHAVDEADRQLLSESFQSQDNRQQKDISQPRMTQQENIDTESTGDNMPKEESSEQKEAKQLEVELRKMLLLSCPR